MRMRLSYDWEAHIGQSRQTFGTKSGLVVKVIVDRLNNEFEIVNHRNEVLVSGGGVNNYIVLLRKIRRALADLGVELVTEERDRDYGIVKKT